MTYKTIFIQILSEVSGKSKQELSELVDNIRKIHPTGKWDVEIPENESQELLVQLRAESPGILQWLATGAAEVACFESDSTH